MKKNKYIIFSFIFIVILVFQDDVYAFNEELIQHCISLSNKTLAIKADVKLAREIDYNVFGYNEFVKLKKYSIYGSNVMMPENLVLRSSTPVDGYVASQLYFDKNNQQHAIYISQFNYVKIIDSYINIYDSMDKKIGKILSKENYFEFIQRYSTLKLEFNCNKNPRKIILKYIAVSDLFGNLRSENLMIFPTQNKNVFILMGETTNKVKEAVVYYQGVSDKYFTIKILGDEKYVMKVVSSYLSYYGPL